jgi:ankyrin repeat protein
MISCIHVGSCVTGSDEAETTGALVVAIRSGHVEQLRAILGANPALASAQLATGSSGLRGPLHVATDWPGYYPHGPEVVRLLIAAGADPNATIGDPPLETPLYWAASTDDVEIAEALIDGGTRTREHPHLPLSARHTVTDHAAARLDS